jgi:hypothetical protein
MFSIQQLMEVIKVLIRASYIVFEIFFIEYMANLKCEQSPNDKYRNR